MRSTRARKELEELSNGLREWETTVPPRARRFHAVRRELEDRIRNAMPSWSLWVGDEVVERLRDRVARLAELAEPLAALSRQADLLEGEVRRLAGEIRLEDAGVAEIHQDRCRDWLVLLGRLGMNCERDSDVQNDRSSIGAAETQIRRHREAALLWIEAERLVAGLSEREAIRGAQLVSQFPQLRTRLQSAGPTPEWLEELDGLMRPLRSFIVKVQDPPPELANVAEILFDLRRWSEALGGEAAVEIQRLQELQFQGIDWDTPAVRHLEEEAKTLRVRLIERAGELRGRKLRQQEEELSDLRQAYADIPDLQARFAGLGGRVLNDSNDFREWQDDFTRFHDSFMAIAQSHMGMLQTRLQNGLQQIAGKLDALSQRPLSSEVSDGIVLLRQDLHALPRAFEIEEVLRQLRFVNRSLLEVARLEQRAVGDLIEIERDEAHLAARTERQQGELRQLQDLDVHIAGPPPQFAGVLNGPAEESLETRRQQLKGFASVLDGFETSLVESCRNRFEQRLRDLEQATGILRRAGAAATSEENAAIAGGASPAEAIRALSGANARYQDLLRQAADVQHDLDARLARAKEEIAAVPPADLTPGDRQDAEQLLAELDSLPPAGPAELLDHVDRSAGLAEKCALFLERLLQVQRDARNRLAALHRRFRRFNEDQLTRFCPELSDRVGALLFGIPEHPRHWNAVHHQLDLAGELFGRIDVQARRRAAEELERSAETLRRQILGGGDPAGGLATLLAELDGWGNGSLPPVTLRLRLYNAAQRRI
jgi:hypothetical protein